VGDAIGTSVEFKARGSFEPVTGMKGGGPFDLAPGEWTDETSMALCLATSLLRCAGFDAIDQMKHYSKWHERGMFSSTGECIDVGMTVSAALARYAETGDPFAGSTNPNSAGNASLTRLAPIPMYYHGDQKAVVHYSGESSRTTHGAPECLDACRYLGLAIERALSGCSKEQVVAGCEPGLLTAPTIQIIADGNYRDKTEADITGSGYVNESLEAALWCFSCTDSFEAAVLLATNLGEDTDTTAAISGQLAGAFYGHASIPETWLNVLVMQENILEVADNLLEHEV
jgi:ADP-ribosyl-[dinitrogen reductase] hydrolase